MCKNLTASEHSVLSLVVKRLNNLEISRELNISHDNVKSIIKNIFSKLGVKNRVLASIYAINENIITDTQYNKNGKLIPLRLSNSGIKKIYY